MPVERNAEVVDLPFLDALDGLENAVGTEYGLDRAELIVFAPDPSEALVLGPTPQSVGVGGAGEGYQSDKYQNDRLVHDVLSSSERRNEPTSSDFVGCEVFLARPGTGAAVDALWRPHANRQQQVCVERLVAGLNRQHVFRCATVL